MGATAAYMTPRQIPGMGALISCPNMSTDAGFLTSVSLHCGVFVSAGVAVCSLRRVQHKWWQCKWWQKQSLGSCC